jgi:probable rRNA maturation factor
MAATHPRVHVDADAFPQAPSELIEAAARRVLATEGREDVEISVALLGDPEMRELNARYLQRDRPTDVLAFALGEGTDTVGDVYVGFEQAERQALELGVPLHEELARLTIHGTLHVLGHDHPEGSGREGSAMFRLQERLLSELLDDGRNH